VTDSLPITLRKCTCSCVTKHPISHFVSTHLLSHSFPCFTSDISAICIPKTTHEAVFDLGWRKAMEVEMVGLALEWNLDFVPLSPGKKTINCKWV